MTAAGASAALAVKVPQVDVNDVEMLLVQWCVEDGERVEPGALLCVLETAKATHDLEAEAAGVVARVGAPGATVRVGEVIAWVGESAEAAAAARDAAAAPSAGAGGEREVRATPKAGALARQHGVDLAAVPHKGSLIKEKDVQAFVDARGGAPTVPGAAPVAPAELPALIAERVEAAGELPRHKAVVARHLAATQREVVLATVETDVRLDAARRLLEREADSGANLFHLIFQRTARALVDFPLLRTFRQGERLFRYKEVGVAFTVVDAEHDHRLYTPVVANADRLSLEDTAEACLELALEAYRGELHADRLVGGCFTISMLTGLEVTRFTALQNRYQSAVLAVGSPRARVVPDGAGGFVASDFVTLTLSYDHGVCEGLHAGSFLTRLKADLEAADA